MTALRERAATLLDGTRPQVYLRAEFSALVDAVLAKHAAPHGMGVQRIVYARDVARMPRAASPAEDTVLVVTVNRGWGATYYRDRDEAGRLRAAITHNPQPSADTPELLYDPEAGATYPPDAAIPADQLRLAIREYLETGQRPTCVQWQQPDRWLTW